MSVRGIRGATSVDVNESAKILEATRELLEEICRINDITDYTEIVSAIFTTSPDINACFPAEAARSMGMNHVPLLCASEINVQGAMQKCIRILLHVNTDKKQTDMKHIYLREAKRLRPDMTSAQ
jgi:chorismate mutase